LSGARHFFGLDAAEFFEGFVPVDNQMVLADDKRGNGRGADNALERLLAVAENFPRPYTFAVFGIFLFFWPAILVFIFQYRKNLIQSCPDNLRIN